MCRLDMLGTRYCKIIKKSTKSLLEETDDKARELLEVFLAAELGVEKHYKVASVGLSRPRLKMI